MASVAEAAKFFPCAAVILLLQATSVLRPTFYTLCLLDCALLVCSKAPKGFCYPWYDVKETERTDTCFPIRGRSLSSPLLLLPLGRMGGSLLRPEPV